MKKILLLKLLIKLTFGISFNFNFLNESIDSGALILDRFKSDVIYDGNLTSSNSNNTLELSCIEFNREYRLGNLFLTFTHSCNKEFRLCFNDDNTNSPKKIAPESKCPISGLLSDAVFYLHDGVIYITISGCFKTNLNNEREALLWIMSNSSFIDYTFDYQVDRFDVTNSMYFDAELDKKCSNLCLANRCDGAERIVNDQLSVIIYAEIGIFIGICACVYFLTPLIKHNRVAPQ